MQQMPKKPRVDCWSRPRLVAAAAEDCAPRFRKLAPHREALLLSHADLVRRIAYHLFQRRNYVDVDDLIQAGMVGLREAIRGHRHHAAGSIEAYASVRIRGAMLDFVRKSDWSLRRVRRGRVTCLPISVPKRR